MKFRTSHRKNKVVLLSNKRKMCLLLYKHTHTHTHTDTHTHKEKKGRDSLSWLKAPKLNRGTDLNISAFLLL